MVHRLGTLASSLSRRAEDNLRTGRNGKQSLRAPYWLVVLRGGVLYSQMMLKWWDESANRLRDLQEPEAEEGEAPGRSLLREHDT